MNWDALGAIGEIVGAAAVVFSVIYLALQIKASSSQAATIAEQDLLEKFNHTLEPLVTNERFAKIISKLFAGEELKDDERISYITNVNRALNTYYMAQTAHQNGQISTRRYKAYSHSLKSFCDTWPDSQEIIAGWIADQGLDLNEEPMFKELLDGESFDDLTTLWDIAKRK